MNIDPRDLRIDSLRTGDDRGGQHVSMNHSGVRVTHVPTGTVAEVTASSQHMSRHIALEMIQWALTYERNLH